MSRAGWKKPKTCPVCRQPITGNQPTQAHPNDSGIGYSSRHVECPPKPSAPPPEPQPEVQEPPSPPTKKAAKKSRKRSSKSSPSS